MSVINILPPLVADMIAAGEVVERPGSVVKELTENSIDAGAKNISVEIRGGGMTYIRVSDDGSGMSPEDAGLAFTRHATSKLKDAPGLEAIGTLGFRGEALAAISAVSRVELLTRRKGDPVGTRVLLEAGEILELGETGCPEGTTIIVRDLFFNTPARLKFMKSDRTEGLGCRDTAAHCALGRPDVSIRFIRDGSEEFFTPGDGSPGSAIYSVLGREVAAGMVECESSVENLAVSGYISKPLSSRGNRSGQFFFCNGRYIKSTLLRSALEQAYKNLIMTGRFPSCVLYLDIALSAVDVNVHPAKTEVKFADEKQVFDAVYYAALSALAGSRGTSDMNSSPETRQAPNPGFFRRMTAEEFRTPKNPAPVPSLKSEPKPYTPNAADKTPPPSEIAITAAPPIAVFLDFRIVGEAMGTYLIAEREGELLLIDKHAAHERIIFDELKEGKRQAMPQTLLQPITYSPGEADAEILIENSAALEELGFVVEPFGDAAVILRAVPAETDAGDAAAMLEEICEALRPGGRAADVLDELLYTVACKAAIKAGRNSEPEELEALAEQVLSGKVSYCPHGRPVSFTLTKKELDKQFRRI